MQITVRFFASLSQTTGRTSCTLDVPPGTDLSQLVRHVVAHFPVLEGHEEGWHFAVNQTVAMPESILEPGDHVAIFPYIAGG